MSAKSNRHKKNQAAESRLMDESEIEQRAVQIARDDGRGLVTVDDRQRAREELLAPNETTGSPEVSAEMGGDLTAWDESPTARGTQAPRVKPEDEASVGKELVEKGLRGPKATRKVL
jgi:hypothetical protein